MPDARNSSGSPSIFGMESWRVEITCQSRPLPETMAQTKVQITGVCQDVHIRLIPFSHGTWFPRSSETWLYFAVFRSAGGRVALRLERSTNWLHPKLFLVPTNTNVLWDSVLCQEAAEREHGHRHPISVPNMRMPHSDISYHGRGPSSHSKHN